MDHKGNKRKSPEKTNALSTRNSKRVKTTQVPIVESLSSSSQPSWISSLGNPREASLQLLSNLNVILESETYDDKAVAMHVKDVRTFFQSGEDHRTAIVLAQMKVLTSLKGILAKERNTLDQSERVKNDSYITTLFSSNCARRDIQNGELYSKRQLDLADLQAL
jgi:hypothetical protein